MSHDTHRRAAAGAAEQIGRSSGGLRFLRHGTNTVFALDGDLIVRVADRGTSLPHIARQRQLAAWLVMHDFPTAAPVGDIQTIDDHPVTMWRCIAGRPGRDRDRGALGRIVRRFHDLTRGYPGDLPEWDPLGRMGSRLDAVPADAAFTEDDRATLIQWRDRLVPRARTIDYAGAPGPLHGDIHLGNAIIDPDGRLWLIDLDRICRGPREWDLAQPIASTARCGTGSLDDFMAGYGADVRALKGMDTLVDLRALFMTSWLLTLPRTPNVAQEIRRRMAYWRGDPDPPTWRPF